MKILTLLTKYFIAFTLFSTVSSKFDFNLHLDKHLDKIDLTPPINYKWSNISLLLKNIVDSVANPNLRGTDAVFKHIDVSRECREAMLDLVIGLRVGKQWAVGMVDATGKIPSGILEGTVMDFGSMEECLRIRVNKSGKSGEEMFRGRYCMVGYQSSLMAPMDQMTPEGKSYEDAYGQPPEWAYDVISRAAGYLKRVAFWFGTCVPSTCSEDDVWKISSLISKPLGFNVSVTDCQKDEPYVWPYYSIAAVSVLGFLAALCAVGTLIDAVCRSRRCNPAGSENEHILLRIPKAFSLLSNTEILLSAVSSGGSLSCFHGIRFLSATWIVLGHNYFYTDTWKYLKYRHLLGFEEQFNRHLPAAVIENFTIPVGSFFVMSGFLLVYTTWRQLEKNNGKLNVFMFIVHKYWRMTPALGLTFALLLAMPVIDSGPIWNSTLKPPVQQCRDMWWASFLYINNWWTTDQYCLIHTWYLAALMQFHILGVLLLILAYRWPVLGVLVGSLIVAGCSAITALLVVWNDFPMPAPGIIKDMDRIDDYNSQIYVKSFYHFPTYMIGMIVAYIFLKCKGKHLSLKYCVLGWTLAIASALLSVYGLYGPGEGIVIRVLYIIGHRIGWSVGVGWLTYACATGMGGIINRFLSWNAMAPLGQLSYMTYLLHPLVIIYRNASLRERVYYGHTELVFSFLSTLVFSLIIAYAACIAIEIPFGILEKIVFGSRSEVNLKKSTYKDDTISVRGMKNIDP